MSCRAALATYLTTFLVPFILCGALAVVIDPYSIVGTDIVGGINQTKIYDPPQDNAAYRALWKTVQIIRRKPDRIILGSSTADGGFDMGDPSYAALNMRDGPIYNAAIRGSNLETVDHYLRHAYANNAHLKDVFLSVDWLFFSWQNRPCCRQNLEPSPLGRTFVPPDFLAEQIWSWYALRDSAIVFDESNHHRISDWISRRAAVAREWSARHWPTVSSSPPAKSQAWSPVFTARSGSEIQRFVVLEQWARQWSVRQGSDYLEEPAFERFKSIVEFCREHSIALHLFLTPQEEIWWAAATRTGIWPAYLEFLRRLAAIHPFWDFAPLIDADAEHADLYFGGDLWHYQNAAGRIILSHILEGIKAGERAGLYVTTASIDEHLRRRQVLVEQWMSANSYQMRFVNSLPLGRDLPGANMSAMLVDDDYHGYWLAQQADHFYAFPGRPRSLDIVDVKEKTVFGMIERDSLGAVKAVIDGVPGGRASAPVKLDRGQAANLAVEPRTP